MQLIARNYGFILLCVNGIVPLKGVVVSWCHGVVVWWCEGGGCGTMGIYGCVVVWWILWYEADYGVMLIMV